MKIKYLWSLILVGLVTFTGCSNEDETLQQQDKGQVQENGTAFITNENTVSSEGETRTSGTYTGSSLSFYWTVGDKLWIKDPVLQQSIKDDIKERIEVNGTDKTDEAKFYFPGIYSAPTYLLRYTGNRNNSSKKVTIKAFQYQHTPNNAKHLGTSGDCGTATAYRQQNGSYKFTLAHKASYLTFAPYYSKERLSNSVTIKHIKVSANENLAGTYAFGDNGLNTSTVSIPSKSVTLSLSGTFNVPSASDYTKNGAIMVIAPGTYTNFTIEYSLADSKTGVSGTVSKTYNRITFHAGRNTMLAYDLDMERFAMEYYMWDAGKHYWNTYPGTLPIKDNEEAPFAAERTNRFFNGNGANLYAVNSCRICPNANEATLYAFRGDAHWDETTLWVMNTHLYTGGMWFKKLQHIDGGYTAPVTRYPDGHDYRQNSEWKNWNELTPAYYHDRWIKKPTQGRPYDTSKYFYLPAMGYLDNHNAQGKLKIGAYGTYFGFYNGYSGAYWTSTSVRKTNTSLQAVSLHFSKSEVGIEVDDRKWGYPIFRTR